ncbi:enoyl-CoA hydratase/isomerase family protein [Novacetimonas hansenii]|uniref:enoyl-CoA hydratase/isomerase family protein n=1 Tax=Novacetimonas hansenii TaxID=436 RepID=UPI000789C068|nr:enoyl-CoA hydratase/isomerase family protein [Novacetimonas hansenii]RFP04691.1 enoyl-CoA hydratase [Novacetimonas hansenii]WEQ58101.1 enoyl-CoA hydratase/isomerase family protein [Novacetimonas hansenii]CUW45962.1 putative enoyl-CoA hydratase echA8 [Novacetimonas hansenii]
MTHETLRISRHGHLGRITLDRPRALNALDIGMIEAIAACLARWREDREVRTIVIDSTSSRAFCAGADLRALITLLRAQGAGAARAVFRTSYRLVSMLAGYPKPVVSFMDGIAMGGGIGLGGHVRHRIVTETSILAMPEVAIALTPDAGGSYLLSRAPGLSGLRLAVTGGRMDGAQAIACGFADRMVPSCDLAQLVDDLARHPAGRVLDLASHVSVADGGWGDVAGIDAVYDAPDMGVVAERLRTCDAPWAQADRAALAQADPFAVELAWRAFFAARALPNLDMVLEQEFRLVCALIERPDFAEGVRARLIDRDNAPQWSCRDGDAVDMRQVAACFASAPLSLDLPVRSHSQG